MASYNADINVRVNGVTQLDRIVDSVNQLNNLARKLSNTPLNVFGRGEAGDLKRTALKPLQDIARAIENGGTAASNTVAKTRLLANGFTDLAQNVKIGSRDYENFIRVAGRATVELDRQTAAFERLLNAETRAARGLQPQEQRDLEVARRQTRRQSLRFRRGQNIAGTENLQQAIDATTSVEQRLNAIRRTSEEQLFSIKLSNLEELYAKELQLQKRNDAAAVADFDRRLNARTRSDAQRRLGTAGSLRSGRLSGIAENAIIGGAFPLLFGQGGAAATGGALGGAIGGVFGGAGGFAGSLLGTLLGQVAGQANQVKELGNDLGFSAQQTQQLATAFKQAGADFDKFAESVSRIQGITTDIETQARAIQLASGLTEAYGGKIDKVTNAFTAALQSGKVTQATLNQLTSQGIPIQQALADKYDVSRSKLLEMAKDGKISVQDLINTLVEVGNEGLQSAQKQRNAFEEGFERIGRAGTYLQQVLTESFQQTANSLQISLGSAVQAVTTYIEEFILGLAEIGRVAGAALDPVISGYLNIQRAIFGAVTAVPALTSSILSFVSTVLGPLSGVVNTINLIRNRGAQTKQERQGPIVPPRLQVPTLKSFTVPAQLAAGAGGGSKKGAGDDAAAREAARVAKLIRDTQAETQLLGIQAQLQQRIFAAEQARDPLLVARLEGERKILDIQFQTATKLAEEKNVRAQETIVANGLAQVDLARLSTAQKLQELETARRTQLNDKLVTLEREAELNNITNEYARELRQIEFDILDLRKESLIVNEAEANAYRTRARATKQTPAQKIYSGMQQELEQLIAVENVAAAGAKNIGQAFGQAFQQVMTGSASAQEALAGMMQSIGENFVNMAAQIIAQQITMIIYGTIMKALGIGGGLGSMGSGGGFGSWSGGSFGVETLGQFSGGPLAAGITPFAEGGFVTGPTPAVVGEGGEPEYIIPASKMSAAMARYGAGARGESVIPGNGGSDMLATGTMPGTAAIDIRYSVERINNVDYVTAEEFQRGMAAAAQQGARQGEASTLRRLQQSTSTRSRLGIR